MSVTVAQSLMQGMLDGKNKCNGVEPELFFPNYNEGGRFVEERAKQVCRACPLMYVCLEFALETEDQHAIMGATTPGERHAILSRRSRAA